MKAQIRKASSPVGEELLPPLDSEQRYSIEEALIYLRISKTRLYEKVAAGEVCVIKDGRRSFVPGREIARLSRG